MILIAIGANLPSETHGTPLETCRAALAALPVLPGAGGAGHLSVDGHSPWYETAPVPPSDQPLYVNGVAQLTTDLSPEALLRRLGDIEADFGRTRAAANAPRILDLDLLAYGGVVNEGPAPPLLPHPRMHLRAFVLRPLADLAPGWMHPILRKTAAALLVELPPGQDVRRLQQAEGPLPMEC